LTKVQTDDELFYKPGNHLLISLSPKFEAPGICCKRIFSISCPGKSLNVDRLANKKEQPL